MLCIETLTPGVVIVQKKVTFFLLVYRLSNGKKKQKKKHKALNCIMAFLPLTSGRHGSVDKFLCEKVYSFGCSD